MGVENQARRGSGGGNGSARRRLADLGVRLGRETSGEHRAACPACARAKTRRGDTALAVRVDREGAAVWLCHRCGWKGSTGATSGAGARDHPPPAPCPKPLGEAPLASGLSAAAAGLWRACRPLEAGCLVARYLDDRGCVLPPNDVRWHPALRHPSGHVGPCMVALVTDAATARPLSLHRTWVVADGGGKAAVDRPRLLLAGHRKAGGVVRLWPDEEPTLGLCVAEGIETALTAAVGFGHAWACLDAGNLAGLPVLGGIECLTVVADHDPAGLAAAEGCARRWLAAGVQVRLWTAPTRGADLNDFARAAA
jgi:putative DNA primase/helicase